MLRIALDDAHDGCSLEVPDEGVHVLLVTQVVASGEEVLDLQLVVEHAERPEVLTQTSLGRQLAVVGEMVVPLVPTHVLKSTLLVRDVISNVEGLGFCGLLDEQPPKFQHGPSDVGLDRNDLADNGVRLGWLRLLFLPLHLLHPILEGTRSPRVLRKDLLMALRGPLFVFRVSLVQVTGHACMTTLAGTSLPLIDLVVLTIILFHRTVIFFE